MHVVLHAAYVWWAVLGLNQRPKDYAYHFGFRRPFPVRGLDSVLPFGLPVESLHVLRQNMIGGASLGVGMAPKCCSVHRI